MVRHIVHATPSGHMHDAVNVRQASRQPGAIEHGARHIPAVVVARRRNIQPYRYVPARIQLGVSTVPKSPEPPVKTIFTPSLS
jgi:hypothetical protein